MSFINKKRTNGNLQKPLLLVIGYRDKKCAHKSFDENVMRFLNKAIRILFILYSFTYMMDYKDTTDQPIEPYWNGVIDIYVTSEVSASLHHLKGMFGQWG